MKTFLKTFYISAVTLLCFFIGIYGAAKVYENARLIGFGEYKKAVEFDGGTLRILDFEIEFF